MAYTIEKGKKFIPADSGCFQYVGRIDFDDPKRPVMAWPGSYADVNFTGTSAAVVLKNINLQEDTHFAVIVDGVMSLYAEVRTASSDECPVSRAACSFS